MEPTTPAATAGQSPAADQQPEGPEAIVDAILDALDQLGVPIGPSTVIGGTLTVGAYSGFIIALLEGARDYQTIALAAIGTILLVVMVVARSVQEIKLKRITADTAVRVVEAHAGGSK